MLLQHLDRGSRHTATLSKPFGNHHTVLGKAGSGNVLVLGTPTKVWHQRQCANPRAGGVIWDTTEAFRD